MNELNKLKNIIEESTNPSPRAMYINVSADDMHFFMLRLCHRMSCACVQMALRGRCMARAASGGLALDMFASLHVRGLGNAFCDTGAT